MRVIHLNFLGIGRHYNLLSFKSPNTLRLYSLPHSSYKPCKMCSCCFTSHVDEGLLPRDKYAPRLSQAPPPQLQSKVPKRKPTTKQIAESYITRPQNESQSPNAPSAPPITGCRSRGASASHGSLPAPTTSEKRSDDPTGNMLYFGTGLSPEQALRNYKSPTPAGSSISSTAGRTPAVAGNASGRDASGYLRSSVGSANVMNSTYSNLTYGGSLQYNFAGTQSYGAGTPGAAGNGLM